MRGKRIPITIDGNTFSSVRKCCEYYGIKPNTVFTKMRRKKISATDAILDNIRPKYEVDGMKFDRVAEDIGCCVDGLLKMQYIYQRTAEVLNGMAS